jgi:competence protein ComER
MNTGFIGVGSMGGMLVRAFLGSGALAPEYVWVSNRSQEKLDELSAKFPGIHIASNRQLAAHCNLLFLSLTAADTALVLGEIDPELSSGQLLLSTTGVIPLKDLEDRVPCRVARLIPSVAQEIGAGIALLMYGSRVTTEDRSRLENLLSGISQPIAITESLAHPTMGLASGGPALIAYVLQSMAEEAVRSNPELPPELARKLVYETAGATVRLLCEANMTAEEVIRRVATPGGMTALAIEVLSRYVPQAWRSMLRETAERATKARQSVVL